MDESSGGADALRGRDLQAEPDKALAVGRELPGNVEHVVVDELVELLLAHPIEAHEPRVHVVCDEGEDNDAQGP